MQSFVPRSIEHRWVLLYEMAVYEIDEDKRLELIALAERAISERKQALAHSKADQIEEEAALDNACYILSSFRNAAEFNRGRKKVGPESTHIYTLRTRADGSA